MKRGPAAGFFVLLLAGVLLLGFCRDDPAEDAGGGPAPPAKASRTTKSRPAPPSTERRSAGKSTGKWTDGESGKPLEVRKALRLTAVPTIEETADEAKATIVIKVAEHADAASPGREDWAPMTEQQYRRWVEETRDHQDSHSVTATVIKKIDPATGMPVVATRLAEGDGTRSRAPSETYNDTESGINITLEWSEDALTIHWTSGEVEKHSETLEIPFSERFRTSD